MNFSSKSARNTRLYVIPSGTSPSVLGSRLTIAWFPLVSEAMGGAGVLLAIVIACLLLALSPPNSECARQDHCDRSSPPGRRIVVLLRYNQRRRGPW